MKKLDLESLCKEAIAKGLNEREVEHVRRYYYNAILKYEAENKPRGPGIAFALQHLEMTEFVAYAAAQSYIRKTIENIQRKG